MNYENEPAVLQKDPVELPPEENMIMGILGALVGAAIGGASIILLSQLGYVASVSGFILAFCTLKGYELLGKDLSKKGIIICVVLMLVAPFIADWIDWAIVLMQSWEAYGVTFAECFVTVPALLQDGSIEMGEYLKNLGMIYLFVVLGGFYTVKNVLKK